LGFFTANLGGLFVLRLLARQVAVEIIQVIMPVGSSSGDLAPHLNPTEHYLLVEQGVVRATIGDETYDLAAGDALYFVGDVPHRFDNIGADEVRYVGVGHGHR
jgi:quercetin dioxygenase-like cupin family protein